MPFLTADSGQEVDLCLHSCRSCGGACRLWGRGGGQSSLLSGMFAMYILQSWFGVSIVFSRCLARCSTPPFLCTRGWWNKSRGSPLTNSAANSATAVNSTAAAELHCLRILQHPWTHCLRHCTDRYGFGNMRWIDSQLSFYQIFFPPTVPRLTALPAA